MIRWFTEDELSFINKTFYHSQLIGIGNKCKLRTKRQLINHNILTKQSKSWVLVDEYKRMFDSWLDAECVVCFKNTNGDKIVVLLNSTHIIYMKTTPLYIKTTYYNYVSTELRSIIMSELELPADYHNDICVEFDLCVSQYEWDKIKTLHGQYRVHEYQNECLKNMHALLFFCNRMIDGCCSTIHIFYPKEENHNEYLYISHHHNDVCALKKYINNHSVDITIGTSNVFKMLSLVLPTFNKDTPSID